jgi:hypothetical protein
MFTSSISYAPSKTDVNGCQIANMKPALCPYMNKPIHSKARAAARAVLIVAVTCASLLADSATAPTQSFGSVFKSQALAPVATPTVVTAAAATAPTNLLTPRAMKLLVLAGDGTEPGLAGLTSFLDQIGIPYDKVLTASQPLPAMTGLTGNGSYQGIILTTGNLSYHNGTGYVSGLDSNGWATLDAYTYNFGVRTVSYYTFPEARYGLSFVSALSTDASPASVAFTAAAASYFPSLNQKNPVAVSDAYVYVASPVAAAGETTTPLLTYNGLAVAAYHKDAPGREYLALTFDNNPYLTHSMAFNYGLFSWVTKGLFLGSRKTYFSPQFDDFFIADIKYNASTCPQGAFQTDPTSPDPGGCKTVRLNGADLNAVANWQSALDLDVQTQQIELAFPFNGIGTTATDNNGDTTLVSSARNYANTFFWLSHTWDHENLDCYDPVPGSGICTPATLAQSTTEITQNNKLATSLRLNYDSQSMVTPNVSGLENAAFLKAAVANNIQYLVCDASVCDPQAPANSYLPKLPPNTGIVNARQPSILEIPRHATNIFYNATTRDRGGDGSETDEYDYFYAGQLGSQSYQQILEREAGYILGYMLRYDAAPLMFHQSNLYRYDGSNSLFTDLTANVISQFKSLSTLPVISLSQGSIGQLMRDRAAYNASGVTGVLTPGVSFTLTTKKAAKIPVTGVCRIGSCQSYGGVNTSTFALSAGGTTIVLVK